MSRPALDVRGPATAEELAAVVAALVARCPADPPQSSRYELWRAGRQAALRRRDPRG